jgi:hypothetical protein
MKVKLDRKDIIALLKGTCPNYNVMSKIPSDLGHWVGGFVCDWQWDYITEDIHYTDEELYGFYLLCKNSWKEENKQ